MSEQIDSKTRSALAAVPPLPDAIYDRVTDSISRRQAVSRGIWAVAVALFIAAAGVASYVGEHALQASRASVAEAADDELTAVNKYVNGGDLDETFVQYVSLDENLY